MLTWHYVTSAAYHAASTSDKTADKLFFLSDTKEIYRGTESFTESIILYSTKPDSPAVGKLYINQTTLEGSIWNGTAWTTVIKPVDSEVTAAGTNPVSGKAVADYVADKISEVTGSDGLVAGVEYVAASQSIKVTMADGTDDTIQLTDLAVGLAYDSTTGALNVVDATGKTLGTAVNLDLERFIESASYDAAEHKIILNFNDDTEALEIPVGDLVDTYTAANSSTISLTVTGNEFKAEAIVAETAGNMLKATDSGLYVAATDISGKVDKVAKATANDIAVLTAEGGISDSGVKAGTSTLGNSATTLATEAAVQAVVATLNTSINAKMTKVGTGHTDEVIVADANGDASASGKKLGGESFNATPNATTLATEAGVKGYVDGYAVAKTNVVASIDAASASSVKVTSEKAIVDAMTWKTTI